MGVVAANGGDPLLEDDVAVLGGFSGDNDGACLFGAFVKGVTFHALNVTCVAEGAAVACFHRGVKGVASNRFHHDDGRGVGV